MVERLRQLTAGRRLERERLSLVVSARSDSDQLCRAALRLDESTLLDLGGELARECEIRATPAILMIDAATFEVRDYVFGGDEEWITHRMKNMTTDTRSKKVAALT